MKRLYYNAHTLPILDYCCAILGKEIKEEIIKLFKLQMRAIKLIHNKSNIKLTDKVLKDMTCHSFYDRCKYHASVSVLKSINKLAPKYVSDILIVSNNKITI